MRLRVREKVRVRVRVSASSSEILLVRARVRARVDRVKVTRKETGCKLHGRRRSPESGKAPLLGTEAVSLKLCSVPDIDRVHIEVVSNARRGAPRFKNHPQRWAHVVSLSALIRPVYRPCVLGELRERRLPSLRV